MSELGHEVLASARKRVGASFRHHFKPDNLCDYGTFTTDACMEKGIDSSGYDCSGLAVASICEVLGITTDKWPRELRHAKQLHTLSTVGDNMPGDIRLFYASSTRIHLAIATEKLESVHASGLTNRVEESVVFDKNGVFLTTRTIAIESICRALMEKLSAGGV